MDTAHETAFNPDAPAPERYDALSELGRIFRPHASDLVDIRPQDIDLLKARWQHGPLKLDARRAAKGPQSVFLDDWQVRIQGSYWEKPSPLNFESLRMMTHQTPILSAIVLTRMRQVRSFCRLQEERGHPGFEIRHRDRAHQLTADEQAVTQTLARFFINCGWEFRGRHRKALGRDSFSSFVPKLVRDSLMMDSMPIETEARRDAQGIDGLYAVDGATIRLCTEEGYEGDDRVFAVQVVQGRVAALYSPLELIYEPRNPITDVACAGYGQGETELLVRIVTGFLNALALNINGFDKNSIPQGLLNLFGNYDEKDLIAFRRYWNAMASGIENRWRLPVLVSKDQEGKAEFVKFGIEFDEMYFSKWMTFLTSIACAIYGMSPDEINFESFSASKSALSGSDTAERLADSKDKGLRPLLAYLEDVFTDYILSEFSDKYVFRWAGLTPEDNALRADVAKTVLTVNELRAEHGWEAMKGPLGEAPVNPSLIGAWMQSQGMGGGGEAPPGEDGEKPPGKDEDESDPPAGEDVEKAISTIYRIEAF